MIKLKFIEYLSTVKNYLGINIEYNTNIMTLSQENYTKLYHTPMETNLKLEKSNINNNYNRNADI